MIIFIQLFDLHFKKIDKIKQVQKKDKKPEISNPVLNSLLGAYSDDDEDESESSEKKVPQIP